MRINDDEKMRGSFCLRVYRHGVLIEEVVEHNLIVDIAKISLARLVSGEGAGRQITKIAFGTNGATPVPSDSAITGAYTKAVDSHRYPVNGQVEFSWSLAASEANGKKIREFGLLSDDGSLFARKTRTEPIAKENDITIDGQWTIVF